jgi:hypothetical protein
MMGRSPIASRRSLRDEFFIGEASIDEPGQKAGRMRVKGGAESTFVHFRQLLRQALGTSFSPDTEGQKRDSMRARGRSQRERLIACFPVFTR